MPFVDNPEAEYVKAFGKTARLQARLWKYVVCLWAAYYLVVFTFGRDDERVQKIIWGGGAVVVLMSLFAMYWSREKLFPEAKILVCFVFWCLLGFLYVDHWEEYLTNLKLVVEMTVLTVCIANAIKHSGGIVWFYWAFLLTGVYGALQGSDPLQLHGLQQNLDPNMDVREAGNMKNPNALGYSCFLGLWGAISLIKEIRQRIFLLIPLVGGCVCVYGIVATASRGAFLVTIITFILWPFISLNRRQGLILKTLSLLFVGLVIIVMSLLILPWVMDNTILGRRLENGIRMQDISSQERYYLLKASLRLLSESPLVGVGLGQFPFASGEGLYAHNELAELLGTTGIIGAAIYISNYIIIWRRLSRVAKATLKPLYLYRINQVRLLWIVLVVSGSIFRPNFIIPDSMFCFAIIIGIAYWAEEIST